jgi:hypothetical protein
VAQTEILVSRFILDTMNGKLILTHRPNEFSRTTFEDSEDEDSNVGKMPPSDSEEDED